MRTLLFGLIATTIAISGCGNNKERERGSVRVRGGATVAPPTTTNTGGTTGNTTTGYGDITGFTENTVKSLVSVSMDEETDMQLPIKGIAMSGNIKISGTSQNVLALGNSTAQIVSGSVFGIYILDNLTVTQKLDPITISFKEGSPDGYRVSGTISNNAQVNMTFGDKYGDIYITGYYNSNDFTGTIKFKNSGGLNPGQTLTLGNFKISTCSFFRCQ